MDVKTSRTNIRKTLSGNNAKLVLIISAIWIIFHTLIASQAFFLTPHKIRIVHLGFALIMIFLLTPINRKSRLDKIGFMDVALILSSVIVFTATYFRYNVLIRMGGRFDSIDIVLGVAGIILLYEAARRVISPGLVILSLVTLVYVFFGEHLTGGLAHSGFSLQRVVRHLYLSGEGVFGFALGVSAEIIVIFVIFGAILQEVGIADYFYDLANAIAGKQRGGPAKVSVISSALMGMVSGETSANVATTGSFTIPLMKRVGYSPDFAGAVECAASAGGQILPPVMGATAFMLADALGIPYIRLATAALLPALLYFTSVFAIVHFRAIRLGLTGNTDAKVGTYELLKRSYLLLPMIGIVFLLVNDYTPTYSAFWGGIVLAVLLSFLKKETRLNTEKIIRIIFNSAKTAMSLAAATAVVGIIVGAFSLTGVTMTIARLIFQATGGIEILTLFMTMIVAMVLGMGLPTSAAYVLASISAAPALALVGIDLMQAHLFVFYFGCMSTITPPVATGAYTAAGIAGGNPNRIGFISMKLAIAGFIVPFIFIYSPELLLGTNQPISKTVITFFVTFIGLIFLSAFFEGALIQKVSKIKRLTFLLAGIMLIWPSTLIAIPGIGLAIVLVLIELKSAKMSIIRQAIS
jgi:TRAP transporter 4TM/12TM fusion protein